jgi:hypothetical protein
LVCDISNSEICFSFTNVFQSVGSVMLIVFVVTWTRTVNWDGCDCVCWDWLNGGDVVGLRDEGRCCVEEIWNGRGCVVSWCWFECEIWLTCVYAVANVA